MIFFFEDPAHEAEYARYVIGFGGETTENRGDATHVVALQKGSSSVAKGKVDLDWIEQCVREKRLP